MPLKKSASVHTIGDDVIQILAGLPHDVIERGAMPLVRRPLVVDGTASALLAASDNSPARPTAGGSGACVWPVHEYDAAMVKLAEGARDQAYWELARHGVPFEQTRILEYEGPGAWRVAAVDGYKPTKLMQGPNSLYSMVALCRPIRSCGRAAVRSPEISDEEARGAVLRQEVYPSLPARACPSCLNSDPAQATRAELCADASAKPQQSYVNWGHGYVLKACRLAAVVSPTGSVDPHIDRVVAVQRELNVAVHLGNTMAASPAGPVGPRVYDAWYAADGQHPLLVMVMQRYQYNAHEVVRRLSDAGGLRPFDEGQGPADGLALSHSQRPSPKGYRLASFDLIRALERGVATQLRRLVDEGLLFGDAKLPNVLVDLDGSRLERVALSDFGGNFVLSAAAASGGCERIPPVDIALSHAMCFASLAANAANSQPASLRDERIVPLRRCHDARSAVSRPRDQPRDQARVLFAAPLTALCALLLADDRLRAAASDRRDVCSERPPDACCAEQRINQLGGLWSMLPGLEYMERRVGSLLAGFVDNVVASRARIRGCSAAPPRPSHVDGQKLWMAFGVAAALSGQSVLQVVQRQTLRMTHVYKMSGIALDAPASVDAARRADAASPSPRAFHTRPSYEKFVRQLTTRVLGDALRLGCPDELVGGVSCFGEMLLVWRLFDDIFNPDDQRWHAWLEMAPSAWLEDDASVALLDRGRTALVRPPALKPDVCVDAIQCATEVSGYLRLALDEYKLDASTRAATVAAIARGAGLSVDEDGAGVQAFVAAEPCLTAQVREAVRVLDLADFFHV